MVTGGPQDVADALRREKVRLVVRGVDHRGVHRRHDVRGAELDPQRRRRPHQVAQLHRLEPVDVS